MSSSGEPPLQTALTRQHDAWLEQGDIFRAVPILETHGSASTPAVQVANGSALLLTHGCALDKPNGSSKRPKVPRLHFARLRAAETLDKDRLLHLRRHHDALDPAEVIYLGEVRELGESFVELSDIVSLPADWFSLAFTETEVNSKTELRLALSGGDSRVASLSATHVQLLKSKMNKYWTRRVVEVD